MNTLCAPSRNHQNLRQLMTQPWSSSSKEIYFGFGILAIVFERFCFPQEDVGEFV